MSAEDAVWGVVVNEVGIFANGRAADWWIRHLAHYEHVGRIVTIDMMAIAGNVYHYAFDGREEADNAREHMIGQGVHGSHLKVVTLASARKSVRTMHGKSKGHVASGGCEYCRDAS